MRKKFEVSCMCPPRIWRRKAEDYFPLRSNYDVPMEKFNNFGVAKRVIHAFVMRLGLMISLIRTISLHSTFFLIVSICSCYICWQYSLYVEVDDPLRTYANVLLLPYTFLVSYCMTRREYVLLDMASFRSSVICYYVFLRSYCREAGLYREEVKMRRLLFSRLLNNVDNLFSRRDRWSKLVTRIYRNFDSLHRNLFVIMEECRMLDSRGTRAEQYLQYLMRDFEKMYIPHQYRSASQLRAIAFVLLSFSGVWTAPFIVGLSIDFGLVQSLYAALLTLFAVLNLFNLQEGLEYPLSSGPDAIDTGYLRQTRIICGKNPKVLSRLAVSFRQRHVQKLKARFKYVD